MNTIKQKIEIGRVGKYLLIVGIVVSLGATMEALGVFNLDVLSEFLGIGYLLIIIGVIFISLRVTAWTLILMAIAIFFFLFSGFFGSVGGTIGVSIADFIFSVVVILLVFGLILAIISFLSHRKKVKNQQKQIVL